MKRAGLLGLWLAGWTSASPAAVTDDAGAQEPPLGADASAPADRTSTPTPMGAVDAAVTVADAPPAPVAGWWNPAWHKRARVTITDPELKEALADFQVPVTLQAPAFDGAMAKGDGSDLRFVTEDG